MKHRFKPTVSGVVPSERLVKLLEKVSELDRGGIERFDAWVKSQVGFEREILVWSRDYREEELKVGVN